MSEFVLGPHNGLHINGTKPRRPKRRKNKDVINLPNVDSKPASPPNPQQCERPPSPQFFTPSLPSDGCKPPAKSATLVESENWSLRQTETGSFEVNINSINNITDFLQTLNLMASEDPQHQHIEETQSETSHDSEGSTMKKANRKSTMPFINFHSELYAPQDKNSTVEWPRMKTALPALLDDCVHYHLQCMNPYFPVRPRRLLMKWYSGLAEPTKDPLVLAISTYFVRHIFMHHMPPAFDKIRDMKVLDAVQTQLALYTREALSDCFDVAHPHHIYALCLYNMNSKVPNHLKAFYHTIAVRMALELNIAPRHRNGSTSTVVDDEVELNNRIWWCLFQIDHFLTESEIISCSIIEPTSDNHAALSKLVRPSPCSLDEPDEVTGSHLWNNILKIWLIRRRLEQEFEEVDYDNQIAMNMMSDKVEREINNWSQELPDIFQQEVALKPENYNTMAQMCFTMGIERCTNRILLHRMFLPLDKMDALNPLQHRSALYAVESVVELLSMRRAVIDIAYCQTWPGDLKRAIEMLMICVKFQDTTVMTRSKLGLMRALRLLRSMPETEWKEDMCITNIARIEQILSSWPESPITSEPTITSTPSSFNNTAIPSPPELQYPSYTRWVDAELYRNDSQSNMGMGDLPADALAFLDSNIANC